MILRAWVDLLPKWRRFSRSRSRSRSRRSLTKTVIVMRKEC
jgi:hypothetical protein